MPTKTVPAPKSKGKKLPAGAVPATIDFTVTDENGNESTETVSVFDVVRSYDPKTDGPWSEYIKSDAVREMLDRKLLINETGLIVPLDGKVADGAAALSAVANAWRSVSGFWEASSGYGMQHYTKFGPMHVNGVDRLSTQALTQTAALFIEVLAQRAGLKDLSPEDEDFAQASAALSILRQFASNRPGEIKEEKKAQLYEAVAED